MPTQPRKPGFNFPANSPKLYQWRRWIINNLPSPQDQTSIQSRHTQLGAPLTSIPTDTIHQSQSAADQFVFRVAIRFCRFTKLEPFCALCHYRWDNDTQRILFYRREPNMSAENEEHKKHASCAEP